MTKNEYSRLVTLVNKGKEMNSDENEEASRLLDKYHSTKFDYDKRIEDEANKLSSQFEGMNKKDRETLLDKQIKLVESDYSKARDENAGKKIPTLPKRLRGGTGRDVIEATTGARALKEIPGYENMSESDLIEALRDKSYKNLPEFRKSLGLGSDSFVVPDLQAIATSSGQGVAVRPFDKRNLRSSEAGSIIHELQHQFDDALADKDLYERKYKDRLYENSKFSGLKKILQKGSAPKTMSRDTQFDRSPEFVVDQEGPLIDTRERRLQDMEAAYPNKKIQRYSEDKKATRDILTDFGYQKYPREGSFPTYLKKGNLGTTGNTLEDQKDYSKGHFIEPSGTEESRALENLNNIMEGGLNKVVKADKFKKLRGLIA